MPKLLDRHNNAVDTVLGDSTIRLDTLSSSADKKSKFEVYDIPLDEISPRPVNEYILSDIQQLADSIERTGLWQPIILRLNHDKNISRKYVIVGGERRYSAVKMLHEKYLQQNDKTMADMFSSIKAVILSSADISKEESIYYETNDNQRVISSFERVLQSDPAVLNFDSEENRRKFIHDVYGNNDPGKIRYTKKDKALWVLALIKKKNPSCEITLKTVQNMLAFIEASSKELIQGILNGIIPLRDGRYLANLTFTEQKEAVESAGTDKYKALLSKAMNGNKKQAVSPDTEKKYLSISRSLIKAGKDFAEIADTLDSKTMNGNQREYLKQIKAVIREISKLEEMPVK